MNSKSYRLCSFCKESEHIKAYHKNVKYLTYLVEESGLNPEQENLFQEITSILREVVPCFDHKSSVQKNKLVSQYYLYFMKHRHIVKKTNGSVLYSPLRKEDVQVEFLKHLELVNDVVKKHSKPELY